MRLRSLARWFSLPAAVAATVMVMPTTGRGETASGFLLEQYIESLRQQSGLPGLSAGIVQNGTLAWERGFGSADLERNIGAAPDTPYPVAGLTTTFSAVEALMCVDRGQLSLESRVADFVPAFDPTATVADVLSHRQNGQFVFDLNRFDAVGGAIKTCMADTLRGTMTTQILERLGMVHSVPGHDFATWSPGTLAQFSDATIERFSGTMTRLAKSYRTSGRARPLPTVFAPTTGLTGVSGLVSTVRDLAKFQTALDTALLLDAPTLAAAWTSRTTSDGLVSPHGLGWFVQTYEGHLVVWQFGVIPDAYSSLIISLPQRGVTFILLANSDGLAAPFPLANGDISVSPFARLFLRLFS